MTNQTILDEIPAGWRKNRQLHKNHYYQAQAWRSLCEQRHPRQNSRLLANCPDDVVANCMDCRHRVELLRLEAEGPINKQGN